MIKTDESCASVSLLIMEMKLTFGAIRSTMSDISTALGLLNPDKQNKYKIGYYTTNTIELSQTVFNNYAKLSGFIVNFQQIA